MLRKIYSKTKITVAVDKIMKRARVVDVSKRLKILTDKRLDKKAMRLKMAMPPCVADGGRCFVFTSNPFEFF